MSPAIPSWFMKLVYAAIGIAVAAFFVKQQSALRAMGEAMGEAVANADVRVRAAEAAAEAAEAAAEATKVAAEAANAIAVADKVAAVAAKVAAEAAKVAAEAVAEEEHKLRAGLEPDAQKWRQVKPSLTPDRLLRFNNAWKLHQT